MFIYYDLILIAYCILFSLTPSKAQTDIVSNALCPLIAATNIGTVYSGWQCGTNGMVIGNVCTDFQGITCTAGYVTSVAITNTLSGSLSDKIGKLTYLTSLQINAGLTG